MRIGQLALALCGVAFVAGAADAAPEKNGTKVRILSPGASETITTDTCEDVLRRQGVSNPTPGSPVTVVIGNFLKNLSDSGKVGADSRYPDGTTVKKLKNVTNNWPTEMDLELARTGETNNYVMITLILRPVRGAQFLLPAGSAIDSRDSSVAVLVNKAASDKFCGRTPIGNTGTGGRKTRQTVSFGVIKAPGVVHSINIGVMIPDDRDTPSDWMPIFLDPNLKNDG